MFWKQTNPILRTGISFAKPSKIRWYTKYTWIPVWHPAGFWSFSGFRDFDILRVFRGCQDSFAFISSCKTCFKSKLMCYKITLKTFRQCPALWKHSFGASKDGPIFDRSYPTRKPDSPCWLLDFKRFLVFRCGGCLSRALERASAVIAA